MIGILRVVGVVNASVWFGASIFFTFFVGPAFFTDHMLALLTKPYAGRVAALVLERYFLLHLICGLIALAHLTAESLYLGRPIFRWTLSLVAAVFVLGLIGAYGIQPRLQGLHRTMYTPGNPPALAAAAARSFGIWHGVSQALNLVMIGGVLVYLLRVTRLKDATRFRG